MDLILVSPSACQLTAACQLWRLQAWGLTPGGGRFVKKTSRKYNFPLIKNNLRHYFYFLPVRVSNILKFWFVCSVNWVLSAVFLQPFFQNSLLFAKQTLFGLVLLRLGLSADWNYIYDKMCVCVQNFFVLELDVSKKQFQRHTILDGRFLGNPPG